MNTKENSSERIYIIDYLKTLAIIMVIFTHYEWENKTTPFFTLVIAMAVPIFMTLSGYNMSMSYHKKTGGSLRELYAPSWILPRLYNLLFPFMILYPLEMLLHKFILGETFTPFDLVRYFFRGGLGPGSYYVPVIITLLFLYPLLFLTVKRFSYFGVAFVGLLQLAYELYVRLAEVSLDQYRLSALRYLLYVALGSYLYFYTQDRKKYPIISWALILMWLCGTFFSLAVYQYEWEPPIFRFWTRTALPAALYIFPIIFLIMSYLKDYRLPTRCHATAVKISQATYYIFLIQMIYYRLFDHLIFRNAPAALAVCGNLVICLSLGYGYYSLHKRILHL